MRAIPGKVRWSIETSLDSCEWRFLFVQPASVLQFHLLLMGAALRGTIFWTDRRIYFVLIKNFSF